jgi:TRAP-type transport system small permease protein
MRWIRFAARWFEEIIACSLLVITLMVLFLGIVSRYVFNDPIVWTEELARFCSTWIIFLGAAACFKRSAHIGIDVIVRLLPRSLHRGIEVAVNLMMMVLLSVLIVRGFQYSGKSFVLHTTVLGIPFGLWNAAVPIGSLFMLIRLVQNTLCGLRGGKEAEAPSC